MLRSSVVEYATKHLFVEPTERRVQWDGAKEWGG